MKGRVRGAHHLHHPSPPPHLWILVILAELPGGMRVHALSYRDGEGGGAKRHPPSLSPVIPPRSSLVPKSQSSQQCASELAMLAEEGAFHPHLPHFLPAVPSWPSSSPPSSAPVSWPHWLRRGLPCAGRWLV